MRVFNAQVSEIRLDISGDTAYRISCHPNVIPSPGRYTLGWAQHEEDAPLATTLFPVGFEDGGFLAEPLGTVGWGPGDELNLRGPLGRGFEMPAGTSKLALAALGGSIARLSPLLQSALARDAAVAVFTNLQLPQLPAAVEIRPLDRLPEALTWADFLALDIPIRSAYNLRRLLDIDERDGSIALNAQALLAGDMPCGGLAECGVCSIKTRDGWKTICKDGPVFDLNILL